MLNNSLIAVVFQGRKLLMHLSIPGLHGGGARRSRRYTKDHKE